MDMKRILQAMDGVATKPVEGGSDMSKFLRIVTEGAAPVTTPQQDPNFAKYAELMAKYDMLAAEMTPDASGVAKNSSPEFVQQVNGLKAQADQLAGANAQAWEQARKAGSAPQQTQQQLATQLSEGANPHKVTLPVQMAMQHYAAPVAKPAPKKPSLLKQYFAEAEEAHEQEKVKKQERLRMYSQKIAARVLESSNYTPLKDKADLAAKRKALQDIQLDPNTHKDADLKAELFKRHLELEKEARRRGLGEARLAPDQLDKLMQFKKQNAKPVQPQSASVEPLSAEKQAEVDQWGKDLAASLGSRTTAPRTHRVAPVQQDEPQKQPEVERSIDIESLSLPELQQLMAKTDELIRVMEKVEKLTLRAERFPGGITPGLEADLELNVPTPTTVAEYDEALDIWHNKLSKLEQFIHMKKATWAKKKTPMYENDQAQQPARDERTIQQEIKLLTKELTKAEYALSKAKQVTREIKYDDTASSIITRIRALAQSGIALDEADLKYAEDDVFNAIRALESAVYGLDVIFEDAVRNTQNKIDDLESEIDEIQWQKKYGRQPGN
jgi:hypothetical protein